MDKGKISRCNGNPFALSNVHASEIDYLENYNGRLEAYEIKWNPKRAMRTEAFLRNYPEATVKRIDKENYAESLYPETKE